MMQKDGIVDVNTTQQCQVAPSWGENKKQFDVHFVIGNVDGKA